MGRIVAIGGGTYEDADGLIRYAVDLSKKTVPNVLFIGTASGDSTNPLTSTKKSFKRVCPGCIVKKLSVVRSEYTEEETDRLLSWADIIYVGGGNTAYMLEKWAETGLGQKLKNIFYEDSAVLSGVSAGAICWFKKGYTDSESFAGKEKWDFYMIEPETGLLDYAFCPHYNLPGREGFDNEFSKTGLRGFALEDNTALIFDNGKLSFRSVNEKNHAYLLTSGDNGTEKQVLC